MKLKLIMRVIILISNYVFSQDGLFLSNNNIPYADAGPDIKTFSGGNILLDATESFSDDGSRLKYLWTFAPGLVLNEENNFGANLFLDTYDTKYLKSIQTEKELTQIKIAANDPGTKLEIFLEVKNSLGFASSDTILVDYLYENTLSNNTISDTSSLSDSLLLSRTFNSSIQNDPETKTDSSNKIKRSSINQINMVDIYKSRWLKYVKYSLMAGGVYLILDVIFSGNSDLNKPELPPGFPHDS
jgi:hypothetical protein